MKEVILASTSIYRKELLERLNIEFTCVNPNVDEGEIKTENLSPSALSETLALKKAKAVYKTNSNAIVIGSDQVLSLGSTILNKPIEREIAIQQLQALSGEDHQLITSVAILADDKHDSYTCTAQMRMRKLTPEQIVRYIDTDQPLQCCGSYRLEASGIALFEHIKCDDYTSIIGLPLMWTAKALTRLGRPIP